MKAERMLEISILALALVFLGLLLVPFVLPQLRIATYTKTQKQLRDIQQQRLEIASGLEGEDACRILQMLPHPSHQGTNLVAYERELLRWEVILRRCRQGQDEKQWKPGPSGDISNVQAPQDKLSGQTSYEA